MTRETSSSIITALITPFLEDGSIDWESFDKILKTQIDAHIDGVVISGTTGEAPTLSVQEKLSLIRRARAQLPTNMTVMAGTGGQSTEQSVELSKLAIDAGANSLLVVTPPYNKPSLKGLSLHFGEISQACNAPIMLYHVPGRTGQWLTANDMAALCRIPGVYSIKEASGDIGLFARTVTHCQARVLSGDDISFLASLSVGGAGVVSVITNLYPKAFVALSQAFESGNHQLATTIHQVLLPMIDILFCESNPGPIKYALSQKGLCKNIFRAPMAPVESTNADMISTIMERTSQALSEIL